MNSSYQRIPILNNRRYYYNLRENKQHKRKYDISDDHWVAAELEVISHANHKEQ